MFIISCLVVDAGWAQTSKAGSYRYRTKLKRTYNTILSHYSDSLVNVVNKYLQDSLNVPEGSHSTNPYYYKLFAPVTLYNSVVSEAFKIEENAEMNEWENPTIDYNQGFIQSSEAINSAIDNALMNIYLNNPQAVSYTENELMGKDVFKKDVAKKMPRKERMTDFVDSKIVDPNVNADPLIKKPNFWSKNGNSYLQFTQNYVSDNWYKGGESNNTLLAGFVFQFNYNDRQKLQWDNKLEWKLGFQTSRSDTLHKFKTNNDLIRFSSKLGLKAIKNWFYTVQAEFYTQLLANYNTNKPDVISSFLSPGYLKFDLGMDYKLSVKKFSISAVLAPLSYKLTYVMDEDVDETRFSLEEGKKARHDLGSNIQVNTAWTIFPQVVWESRATYFTTYDKSQADWENTFNFNLNKYLSTKLFVHVRFDDGVKRKEGGDYMQLSEILSFGLSYNW